jgi:hypothetical protein
MGIGRWLRKLFDEADGCALGKFLPVTPEFLPACFRLRKLHINHKAIYHFTI